MRGDDEKLSAMLDGELNPPGLADMQSRVAKNPKLQAKLADMAQADDLVRAVFNEAVSDEIPGRFLKTIDAGLAARAPVEPTGESADNVIPLRPQNRVAANDSGSRWWRFGGAIAAGLALGLVIAAE